MRPDLDRLAAGKYLLVITYRKDGTPVPTPVWMARDGDSLVAWTPTSSGKVKRIRRDGTVEVAPCDRRGNPTGESVPARAEILDPDATEYVRGMIAHKYGFIGRLTMWGSTIRRGKDGTVGLRITTT